MKERGISLIALIVTVIIIILLTTIGGYYTIETLNKSERMDVEEELRNVEELIAVQRAKVQSSAYTVTDKYIASDTEIDSKYGALLSSEAIEIIKDTNNNANIPNEYKYHLMSQADFDAEFGDDVNVRRLKREYLVNFGKKVIVVNANNKLHIIGKIESDSDLDVNEIRVTFEPNGNNEWAKAHSAKVTVEGATVLKYAWLQDSIIQDESSLTNTFYSEDTLTIDGVTGNDWYLWVYAQNENGYSTLVRSEAFYIDNASPEGTLTVE